MSPRALVPTQQVRAFQLAACERLGVDPLLVSRVDWEVTADDGILTVICHLPGQEVIDLWNGAVTRPVRGEPSA